MHGPRPSWAKDLLGFLILSGLSLACDDGGEAAADAAPEPVFPADYAERFTEIRDCRQSIEHELAWVRLLVPADQAELIRGCMLPGAACTEALPQGTLLVKPQYHDANCTDLALTTAALRVGDGPAGDRAAWRWQSVTPAGAVTVDGDAERCVNCHAACDPAFDLRCVMDP